MRNACSLEAIVPIETPVPKEIIVNTQNGTANAVEIPDFKKANLNRFSDEQLTASVVFSYFAYVSEQTKILCAEAQALLTKEDFLSCKECHDLMEQFFILWDDLWQNRVFQKLYRLIVEKAIASLADALAKEKEFTKIPDQLWSWFVSIEYQLQSGRRLGIGSHGITIDKSRQLIESLVPIVQLMKNDYAMGLIANDRFPGDEAAQATFITKHKNW